MPSLGIGQEPFGALVELMQRDHVWAKVSGLDRISRAGPPYADLAPFVRRLAELAPGRLVWRCCFPMPGCARRCSRRTRGSCSVCAFDAARSLPILGRVAAATFLLAADGSPASQQAARLLAGYAGDRDAVAIELLNVQSRPIALWPEPGLDPGRLDEALLREGAQAVTAERAALSAAGFDAPVAVRLGFPAESIAEEALRRWATAIVMGTRGHGPVGGFAVGSVAMRVAHRAHVPTILVQADSRLPASLGRELRVLVPLDGSVHGARAADEVRR